jgi:hypothetical protein
MWSSVSLMGLDYSYTVFKQITRSKSDFMCGQLVIDLTASLRHNLCMRFLAHLWLGLAVSSSFLSSASASPVLQPGDTQLRHDLEYLIDNGIINIPLSAWPLSAGDVHTALQNAKNSPDNSVTSLILDRLKQRLRDEMDVGFLDINVGLSGSHNPRVVRSFENTPREEGEVRAQLSWLGERFAVNLAATYASNPFDGEDLRPDGTYLGVALGNWMVTAGWQERWWGPGREGSLILSTNARPMPGIGIQRISSAPFKTKWLSWMGPWTFTSFMNQMDDERVVRDGLLFGMRGSFRPTDSIEIGLSRTAQWCGDGRKCDFKTFLKLLNGNDNRGANVDPEDEPGNQLGGIDIRWTLPNQTPVALYMQWIAEDTRRTGYSFHQWLRQVGVEYWGPIGDMTHRTYIEISDTASRLGGFGEGSITPNFAYNHAIFKTGYRYRGRSIGHPADGDSLSYSLGSTLVQSGGQTWDVSLRYIKINRIGVPQIAHSLSATPQELADMQFTHNRMTRIGRFHVGLGFSRLKDSASGITSSDASGFIQWSSQ